MSETSHWNQQCRRPDVPAAGGSSPRRPTSSPDVYDEASADRLAFWEEAARRLTGPRSGTRCSTGATRPFAKWFVGGKLNVAYNCVDRHVEDGHGDQVAYHWEGEPADDTRTITYAQLKDEVCKAANALLELGVQAGDRVAIYMPMIPETIIAMLACARIGAVHMVVFGGFSADALASRLDDAGAVLVITSDGGYRRGAPSALKPAVDDAVSRSPGVRNVVVVKRTGQDVEWTEGRDLWWDDVVERQSHRARRRSRSTPSTRSTSCTRQGRRRSRRASCTRPAAT